jgi:hypothetical protein
MLSVITCVGNYDKYNDVLLPSLHKTTEFLWRNSLPALNTVVVEGSNFNNIAEAYNYGKNKATYPIKVFVHEDLDLLDPSWVLKILYAFSSNPNCGLIGLVGTQKVNHFDNWWTQGEAYIYGKQFYRENKTLMTFNPVSEIVKYGMECIDGCFLATNRNIFFDTSLFYESFLSAYEHDLSKQIKSLNLDIGVIDHNSWHVCATHGAKRDPSKLFESYRKKWGIEK